MELEHEAARFVPLYVRIARQIVALIRTGALAPGERIPSENEIRARHGVSSTTARKVLAELERDGWIVRQQGKGSFVGKPLVDGSTTRITSFTANMRAMGLTPSTRVLKAEVCTDGPRELLLGDARHALPPPCLHLVRLRLGDGAPVMLEDRYIDLALCPGLEARDLSQSLFSLYEDTYGCLLLRSRQLVSAVALGPEEARRLDCAAGAPGLQVLGALFTANDRLIELERCVYRGDRYSLAIDSNR